LLVRVLTGLADEDPVFVSLLLVGEVESVARPLLLLLLDFLLYNILLIYLLNNYLLCIMLSTIVFMYEFTTFSFSLSTAFSSCKSYCCSSKFQL
jgi:hypothetical protein